MANKMCSWPRNALGDDERKAIEECLRWHAVRDLDPGYQGEFERRYCAAFTAYHGGGFADAVATGTAALFVALKALNLPSGSEILCSPIADPGVLSAIILAGYRPRLIDSLHTRAFTMSYCDDALRWLPTSGAVLLIHPFGRVTKGVEFLALKCARAGVPLLEDCSQSHGARRAGQLAGTFGTIAAFSTMHRKAHITGGCGGVIYTQDEMLHRRALAHADRGKPSWLANFNDRDPRTFLFPALNLHSNELACAIGLASLARLDDTRARRLAFVSALARALAGTPFVCEPFTADDSPFIVPLWLPEHADKRAISDALRAANVGHNADYEAYLAIDWPWLKPYLSHTQADTPSARRALQHTIMLYVNENYDSEMAELLVAALRAAPR